MKPHAGHVPPFKPGAARRSWTPTQHAPREGLDFPAFAHIGPNGAPILDLNHFARKVVKLVPCPGITRGEVIYAAPPVVPTSTPNIGFAVAQAMAAESVLAIHNPDDTENLKLLYQVAGIRIENENSTWRLEDGLMVEQYSELDEKELFG